MSLKGLARAASVTEHDGNIHIASHGGPATVAALMESRARPNVIVRRVSVQGTTLDDVFLHYTGRELRDATNKGATYDIGHLYR